MPPLIEIICVTYRQYGPLNVLVQSFINQTADNWKLVVYHDGPNAEFDHQMDGFERTAPGKIKHYSTPVRYNDWGHSLRDLGLKRAKSDYVLLTNGDNYYVPKMIEMVTGAIEQSKADVVIFDMVHSHPNAGGRPAPAYAPFKTEFEGFKIDIGAAVVRTKYARAAGFQDKRAMGDANYIQDLRRQGDLVVCKLNSVLFVHN